MFERPRTSGVAIIDATQFELRFASKWFFLDNRAQDFRDLHPTRSGHDVLPKTAFRRLFVFWAPAAVLACQILLPVSRSSDVAFAAQPKILAAATENIITPAIRDVGVYEDLYARTLVLSDGTTKVALVALDLGGLSPVASADRLRKIVHRASGIPIENIALICSHTHNARSPEGDDWLRDKQPSTAVLPIEEAWFADLEIESDHTRWLYGQIAESVKRAASSLRPATLRTGRQHAQIGHNRRKMGDDGLMKMTPNLEGAVVPWVDVLEVVEATSDDVPSEKRIALLFSHAAHPVIVHETTEEIGPDFPGYAVNHLRRLQAAQGRSHEVTMFAQGCGGNINGYPLRGGTAAADAAGLSLAMSANQATSKMSTVDSGPIRIASRRLALPLRVPTPEEARRWLSWRPGDPIRKAMVKAAEAGEPKFMPFPLTVLSIGDDLCFVLLAQDIFAEYQLFADKESSFGQTFVFGYVNGTGGYVGTKADYDLGIYGGYETSPLTSPSGSSYRFPPQPRVEAQIHEAIREMLAEVDPANATER